MKPLKPAKPFKALKSLAPRKTVRAPKAKPSSMIQTHSYDPAAQKLHVTFNTGKSFTYSEVPQHIATGLRDAPSKGKFFHSNIRGTYAHKENVHE